MNFLNLLFLFLLVAFSLSCRGPKEGDATSNFFLDRGRRELLRAAKIRRGEGLYWQTCLLCYGEEGRGDGYNASTLEVPPRDLADQGFMRQISDEQLYAVIARESRSHGKSLLCHPWERVLKEEEIGEIIIYVRNLGRSPFLSRRVEP